MAGGLLTAGVVYLLAWSNGVETFRLIIVGIGRSCPAVGRQYLDDHQRLIGSVHDRRAVERRFSQRHHLGEKPAVLAVLLLALLVLLTLTRRMRLLEMGDDTACALGVGVERSRLLLLLVGVILTAAATAVAGPISFIALVAPQIARRLCANQHVLLLTALTGGLIIAGGRCGSAAPVYALSVAGRRVDRQHRWHLSDLVTYP
ncbi:Ferric enterobactin transport system permease protein fepG [Serratia fonticola]|uniref:Ferric enterobactin transport system permease protein fepG n=1 Tax=Serratia fonticola TaxID=47917 RepID=A0A4U9TDJ6_SERFO|nr:Ferric enterobactin transport system permease protein fepG [Serratia fonticola]